MKKPSKTKEPSGENFDMRFNKIIKSVISEENYFKEENVKILMKDILKEIDPLIANHVKDHLREIAYYILNQVNQVDSKSKRED